TGGRARAVSSWDLFLSVPPPPRPSRGDKVSHRGPFGADSALLQGVKRNTGRSIMKRFLGTMFGALMVSAVAAAAVHARYRITLRDGREIVASDTPVRRGSVVTFRRAGSGVLTGLPAEEIVSIRTGAAEVAERPSPVDVIVRAERGAPSTVEGPAQPLRPGDVVDI